MSDNANSTPQREHPRPKPHIYIPHTGPITKEMVALGVPRNARSVAWSETHQKWVYDPPTSKRPMPENFPSLEFPIGKDLPIPHTRRSDIRPEHNNNFKTYNYPVHNPNSSTYKLYSALDKLKVGEYISMQGRDVYEYAYAMSQQYAHSLRINKKYPIPMRIKCIYDASTNTGRIFRVT